MPKWRWEVHGSCWPGGGDIKPVDASGTITAQTGAEALEELIERSAVWDGWSPDYEFMITMTPEPDA